VKVVPFSVPSNSSEAFRLQIDEDDHFYDQLHQHPELQIMLIVKSEGTLVAGDWVGRFETNDLFIIGSEQPHVFRNDESYYKRKRNSKAKAISLFIHPKYLGDQFWNLDEMKAAREFLKSARRGFKVMGKAKEELTQHIYKIMREKGLNKLFTFLQILQLISKTKEMVHLSVTVHQSNNQLNEGKRMNNILHFTFRESHRKIYLHEVAEIANLSVEAFCRYFKIRTRKTYTTFLNEVRVSNACQLLLSQEVSIQDVCYQAGFNNISNFNRIFKKVTGKAPTNYLKQS
jgi:YesN/AraC family two-component response regulator